MILIDYSGIAISNVIVQKLDLDENLIRHMILNSLRMYRKKHRAKYGELVICCDAGGNWRKQVFPLYKAQRKDARDAGTFDWDRLFEITNTVLEELEEYFPYKVLKIHGCEADDIIAALAYNTQEFGQMEPVLIVSSDKDFVQLQRLSNVDQYSPMKKSMVTEANPRTLLMEHVLKGDVSDGVPNVLSADNCLAEGIRQTPLTAKKKKALLKDPSSLGPEVVRNIQRNIQLIDLSKTPAALKAEIINSFESQDKTGNKEKVMGFLAAKDCKLLIEDLGDFIND